MKQHSSEEVRNQLDKEKDSKGAGRQNEKP